MALKDETHHLHHDASGETVEPTDLAAQLAPPEEQPGHAPASSTKNGGAILVDTARLQLPKGFAEEEKQQESLFHLDPIAIFILLFALAFISLIAYLISTGTAS